MGAEGGVLLVPVLVFDGFGMVELTSLFLGLLNLTPCLANISLFTVRSSIRLSEPSITGFVSPLLGSTFNGSSLSCRVANIPRPK